MGSARLPGASGGGYSAHPLVRRDTPHDSNCPAPFGSWRGRTPVGPVPNASGALVGCARGLEPCPCCHPGRGRHRQRVGACLSASPRGRSRECRLLVSPGVPNPAGYVPGGRMECHRGGAAAESHLQLRLGPCRVRQDPCWPGGAAWPMLARAPISSTGMMGVPSRRINARNARAGRLRFFCSPASAMRVKPCA